MAKAKYNNMPEDEKKKKQIAAHKEAAASISSKMSSDSSKASTVPVNTAAKKVSSKYGGVPVNTTKGMGSVSKGAAFNRAYGDYYASQNKKWYSGSTPTNREMVARIYEVSNGDSVKFNELMSEYDQLAADRGSVIYNPYAQATNYKEIEALQAAGIDVSGGITAEWFKENQWLRNHARTNTGYGALAPTKSSTNLQNAAWAYENLLDAETRTAKAEAELAAMARETKYWADLGYSDNEIVARLKNNDAYGTLWAMDEERLKGDAVRLNRAVDYSGDDTIYGMIWAARNNGGTGNYFTDSVKYTMGQGNRYKSDPYSEAARDPSNFEGYHPYIMGSTLHSLNQKYGVTSVDQAWLDEHRYMLNDPDTAGDYRKYAEAFDLTQTAEAELAALDMWISQQMERSTMTEKDLIARLEAAIADGAKIEYRDADGKLQSINLTTLSRMERERGYGSSLGIAYAVDFTLPRYKDKVHDMYAEKAAAEAPEAPKEAAAAPEDRVSASYSWLQRAIADITGGKFGSYGAGDAVLEAQFGANDAQKFMQNFMKDEFGIDFVGDLTEDEEKAVLEAIAATQAATKIGASKEEIAAAAEAENKLFLIGESIAQQPDRHASYKDEAAYSTIRPEGVQDDLYARGMADGEFTPQAYVGGAGVPSGVAEPEENRMGEYEAMLRGSAEWDSDLFAWALEHSTNPDLVLAELRDGIAKQMRGEEGNAVSKSWMRRFGGLTRNAYPTQAGSILGFKGISDSRATYGEEIYNALLANDKALQMGAISNDEYIRHIVDISTAADAVSAQLSENTRSNTFAARTINKTASEVLASGDGSLGAGVAAIEDYCNERIAGKEAENAAAEETNRALIVSGRDALTEGRELTPEEQEAVGLVLAADTLEQQRKDKTYKNYNYILDTYAPDDTAPVDEAGSIDAAHKRGVSMLAQNTLNQDMHFAAALGMSLKEYYEAYPEQAKTAEEMLANAETEFNTAWDEFGRSPEGLEVLNVFLETGVMPSDPPEGWENATEGGSGKLAPEYDMNAADVFAMASNIWGNKLDMNLAKTMHFFRFDFPSEENSRVTLIHKYGNDPQQLRKAWDDLLVSDDRLLTDSVKSEIQARLDTATDIFAVGDPDELYGQLDIADYAEYDQYFRDIVQRNGSPLEATLVDAEVAVMDMATMAAMTAAGNLYSIPGYFTSLLSTAPGELSSAYDYMRANPEADSNAVAAWTISAWIVNAAIEKWSLDKWTTPNVDMLDNAIDHARYVLGKKKLMKYLFEPGTLSTLAKGAAAYLKKGFGNAVGEAAEETTQSLVSSVTGNIATQKGYMLAHEDVWNATREGFMGFLLGGAASVAIDGMDTGYTDEMGNAIAAAEKLVAPEAAGTIINEALEFEATQAALTASAQQLAELENDPDNVAMKQAEEDVALIEEELTAADAALEEATNAQQEAALALENINLEAIENDAFTEEMGKQMVEATAALDEANKAVEAATQSQQDAQTRLDEARARLEESSQKVQQKYRAIIEPAKAKAAQMIADRYYNGSTEEMKAASERYLTACAKLEEARARLREAQANNADAVEQGREMLAVDALEAEVEAAKAELDEAYANAPESKVDAEQQEELTKAQETAQAAEEAATADPGDTRKRAAADLAQRRLEAVTTKQNVDRLRENVSLRLKSSDPITRAQAVADWQAAQKEAADALKAAEDAEAAFNETDAQKELTEALGEARRYTTEQLLFDMEGHDEAVAAYNRLEEASAVAAEENAFKSLKEQKPGTPEYDAAFKAYNQAVRKLESIRDSRVATNDTMYVGDVIDVDEGAASNYNGNRGDINGNARKRIYRGNVRGASGIAGQDSRDGTSLRSESGRQVYGYRSVDGWEDSGRSARDVSTVRLNYESVYGIRDVSSEPALYVQALANGKAARPEDGHQVSAHSIEDITEHGLRPFLTANNLAGFAIEPNGNITGVFKNPANKQAGVMKDMMLAAIQEGGDRLDCYAGDISNTEIDTEQRMGYLPNLYARFGFEPVCVVKYNPEYAESPKVQDIVFFVHNGKSASDVEADYEAGNYVKYTPEDLLALKQFGPEDYDAAIEYRDGLIQKRQNATRSWRDTGGWGDHRTPGKTGETTVADQNPIEIMADLTRSINVGYNPGGDMSTATRRMPKEVQGFYAARARAITTRTNARRGLETELHEFGHAVHDRMKGLRANQQLLNGLSAAVRAVYSASELDGEAIAEFVVDYIFNRDEAIRQAGEDFVLEFEERLQADKKLANAIAKATQQVALWNNASVESRIDAMVKDSTDPRRGQVGSWLRKTLRNIETAVFDLTAPADLVSKDFRQRALYSMHASRRADIALTRYLINPLGENIGKSLAERFYDAGVTEENQQEIIRFALARHALDRRAADKDVFSEAEFSTEELESIVNNAPKNIVAGADALVSFWNDFMDAWWVDTGMIDQDSVDRMRKLYPHYVPTFRVMEKNFKQFGGGSSKFQMKGAVKGGSSLEVINPIASIVKMTQQMVSTVTQNDLLRAFNAEYKRGGLGEIAQDVSQEYRKQRTNTTDLEAALEMVRESGMVDPALMDDVFAEVLNLQERWYGTGQNFAPNVVSGVDEYGTPFFYKIKSGAEGLYGLLSGSSMKTKSLGAVWDGVRTFKNVFTKLTTSSNPLFAIKNMQRDIQSSVNTGTYALTYADGMVRWIGALYDVLTNAELYQEWQAMGGGSHTRYNTELSNNAAGALTKELGSALMRGTRTKGGDFKVKKTALERISNLLTWEQFNNAIENASRYVEYKYGKHDLSTPKGRMEAFMRSQDVTTNFGTHGSSLLLRYAGQIVPFMNATLQGLNKDIHLVADLMSKDANVRRQAAPKVAKTLMNTALTAMLQYALLKMFKGKDDDEDYAILNQEMRTGNLIIPIPKALMQAMGDATGFNKPYIRIPIAQGPVARSIYAAALDITANVADYSPMEVEMGRAVWNILADSFPDGTVFQAWTDVRNNRTWYGGEIESEYERENRSVGNRFDEDTPRAVIWLAQKLGTSPAKLDYLLNQYSGFGGKIIMPLISPDNRTGKWSLGSAVQNLANSVLSAYTIDPVNTNDLSSDYSTAKSTITQIIGDYKAGLTVNNISYSVDPEQAYDAAVYLNKEFGYIDEQISAAWSEYHYIKNSDMPDGEASRRMRDIIRDQIVPLEQEAIALYEEYKMQYIDNDVLAQDIAAELPWGIEHQTIE